MIAFRCENCGQKFRMPESRAGKKGRCPKCKGIIVVPETQGAGPAPADSENSPYNLTLLDVPQKAETSTEPQGQSDVSGEVPEDPQALLLGYRTPEPESPPERKLPWLIDIFLYPANMSGLTILALLVGVPLLLHLLTIFLALFTRVFPPVLVLLVLCLILRILMGAVLACYVWWYFCECIRESALGELRAPETVGKTPGLWELVCVMLRIICLSLCFLSPAVVYAGCVRRFDMVFWVLYACSAFFFPMGLLAITMFQTINALNPLLIVGSIFSTFFQYFGLVLFYYIPTLVVPVIVSILPRNWLTAYITEFITIYFGMITAHLIGRFFFKYQEKLNWEV